MTIEFEQDPDVEPEINLISEVNLRSASETVKAEQQKLRRIANNR